MDELMGITDEEKATVLKEHSERRKEGGNEVTANLGELQGEELLRAIVKRQMRVAVPRSPVTKVTEGNGKDKKDGLSIGDLVKESDFW